MRGLPASKRGWGVIVLVGAAVLTWLFNVSKAGLRPSGCPQGCAAPAKMAVEPLRIVTWNVLHGYPEFSDLARRLELIAATLQEQEADIILLQEVAQTRRSGNAAAFLAERLGMNYVYARANGNQRAIFFEEGEAILSRFPLADPRAWELEPQAGFFEHRIVLSAGVAAPQGRLTVYTTHLTDGEVASNQAQAAHLKSIVSQSCSGLCLIGGDFNALPESPQIGELSMTWSDSFTAHVPGGPGYTCCLEAEAAGVQELTKRIDYLFLAAAEPLELAILESRTIPTADWFGDGRATPWPSDHLGVLVVFRIGQRP